MNRRADRATVERLRLTLRAPWWTSKLQELEEDPGDDQEDQAAEIGRVEGGSEGHRSSAPGMGFEASVVRKATG